MIETARKRPFETQDIALGGLLATYIAVFLLPIEFAFYLGPVFLPPTRLMFLLLAVPLLIRFLNHPGKIWADYLLLAYAGWVMLAHFAKRGFGGIEAAGQSMVEIVVPYLVARLFLHGTGRLQRFYRVMAIAILVLGLLAIPEAVLGQRYLHDIPAAVTGIVYEMQSDTRLGLLRAASTFENPILFGMYCATFLSLFWFSADASVSRKLLAVGGVTLATAMSLSSAPLLMLAMQFGFVAVERMTRGIASRVKILLITITVLVLFLEVFSDRGTARLIASYLTFNPHTGYYRLLQWDFSIDDVMANPIFGILLENWTRPFWLNDSVDNHWLLLAMTSGIPAVLLIWGLVAGLIWRLYRRRKDSADPVMAALILGWILGMVALYLGGWTVAFFGKMHPALFFFLGIGSALLAMPSAKANSVETGPASDAALPTTPYSRFPIRRFRARNP